ncbi:hypothetical protein J3D55_003285 [Chryseobacterium ginsenosidimutans]|nr:hypothetical protein [Chryseobacterium ginsenosidimutans]
MFESNLNRLSVIFMNFLKFGTDLNLIKKLDLTVFIFKMIIKTH